MKFHPSQLRSLFSGVPTFTEPTSPTPVEPPHALRQHFNTVERTVSVSPLHTNTNTNPHTYPHDTPHDNTHSTLHTHADPHTNTHAPAAAPQTNVAFPVFSIAPMIFANTGNSNDGLTEIAPAKVATRAVLYLLPGGFIKPVQERNWAFISELAKNDVHVEVPLYGRLPDHDIRHAIPLITKVYSQLAAAHGADNITVIADSCGGGLALGTLFFSALAGTPLPQPNRMILNAPWVDMDLRSPEIAQYQPRDPLLNAVELRQQGHLWAQGLAAAGVAGKEQSIDHPAASPLRADTGTIVQALSATQVHIFCGERDISMPDSQQLTSTLRAAGITTEFHDIPDGTHMLHLRSGRAAKKLRNELIDLAITK